MAGHTINFGSNNRDIVSVVGDHNKVNSPEVFKPKGDKTKAAEEEHLGSFGDESTIALLLFGVGKDMLQTYQFNENQGKVTKLLTDHFDISEQNIHSVSCDPRAQGNNTRETLFKKFDDIGRQLKRRPGNFLFYYLGHNDAGTKSFNIDNSGKDKEDWLSIDDLKGELRIPCKFKLFILDCCYSGGSPADDIPQLYPSEDTNTVQWCSSLADEKSFFANAEGYFTRAIREVLTDMTCQKEECVNLRQEVGVGNMAAIVQLHICIQAHLGPQSAVLRQSTVWSRGDSGVLRFPLLARLKSV